MRRSNDATVGPFRIFPKFRICWIRGEYFSKNQYFFTNAKNGPARDSRDTQKHTDLNITAREKKSKAGTGVPAYGEIFTSVLDYLGKIRKATLV